MAVTHYRDSDFEEQLPKEKLYALCRSEVIQKYVRTCDYQMYQALVEVLIPDVLRPIPSKLPVMCCAFTL